MRASVIFKLAIAGWMTAMISACFMFAGFPEAKPVGIAGFLVGFGAIAAGVIANVCGVLENDLKERKK